MSLARIVKLYRFPLSTWVRCFSVSTLKHQGWCQKPIDPVQKFEAPRYENKEVLEPDEAYAKQVLESGQVQVPAKVDLTPVSGVPLEHICTRCVRIYVPTKNAMQDGPNNSRHWEIKFDKRQCWENPLMGWTSGGDPLSSVKVQFSSCEAAIELCEKNGWCYIIDAPKAVLDFQPKSYGINFSWNRRTRVTTK